MSEPVVEFVQDHADLADDVDFTGQEIAPVVAQQGVAQRMKALGQRGLVSAEWALVIIAAAALAGVLGAVLTDGTVQTLLLDLIGKIIKNFATDIK